MTRKQPVEITTGKPTSGRFVYRSQRLTNGAHTWVWQCDLHDEEEYVEHEDELWGEAYLWADTITNAFAHANACPYVSRSVQERHSVVA